MEGKSSLKLMSINDTKAGMEGLDKAAINAIIAEASKGSKFYEAKSKAQKRIDAKKEVMTNKMRKLSFEQIKVADHNAEKIIEDLANTEIDHSRTIVHCDMVRTNRIFKKKSLIWHLTFFLRMRTTQAWKRNICPN